MKTLKLSNPKNTKIIAHRGLSGIHLENTMSAFKAAGKRNYYGIETDVHVTADGNFVVFHDDTTGRIARIDLKVEDTSYLRLRLLPLGLHRMPNLYEYIRCCKSYNKHSIIELKNPMTRDNIKRLIGIIDRLKYLDNTVFISFSGKNLEYIREFLPNQTVQFLHEKFDDNILGYLIKNRFDFDINYLALDKKTVDICHDNGIKVNCWTVDSPEVAERLIDYGVDYITTNIIEISY